MPDAPVPLGWRTTLVFTLPNGDVAENVLHWGVLESDPMTQAVADNLAGQINDAWINSLQTRVSTGVKFLKVITKDLRSVPYPTFETYFYTPGGDAATALPWQLAVVSSLHTVHPGRSGRGRVYWAGFCEDSNDAGGLVSMDLIGAISDMTTLFMDIEEVSGFTAAWCVFSRKDNTMYGITDAQADQRWDVQRRRANRRIA